MLDQKAVNQRVIEYSKYLGLSDVELARQFGVQKQFVTQWKENTGVIPLKRLIDFFSTHADLDIRWCLFGEGEMLKSSKADRGNRQIITGKKNITAGEVVGQVNESAPKYGNQSALLEEKDRRIEELKETIAMQKKMLDKLMG